MGKCRATMLGAINFIHRFFLFENLLPFFLDQFHSFALLFLTFVLRKLFEIYRAYSHETWCLNSRLRHVLEKAVWPKWFDIFQQSILRLSPIGLRTVVGQSQFDKRVENVYVWQRLSEKKNDRTNCFEVVRFEFQRKPNYEKAPRNCFIPRPDEIAVLDASTNP